MRAQVKRSRDHAFAPERIVVLSGDDKRARNTCVLVGQALPPARLLDCARSEAAKRPASPSSDAPRKQPRVVAAAAASGDDFDAAMDAAIWTALSAGDFAPVLSLVAQGRDVNARRLQSPDGATALIAACRRGDVATAERLLRLGADPELADGYGAPPMAHAAAFPAVQALLRRASEGAVFDLYAVHAAATAELDALPAFVPCGAAIRLDPATGDFIELVHDAADSDFGENDAEDSDSNEEGYYERKLDDDEDDCDDDALMMDAAMREPKEGWY